MLATYIVTRKSDGQEVYRYASDAPIEWDGMGFATHDHVAELSPASPSPATGPRRLSKLQFIDRLGDAAHAAILTMARQSIEVEVFVERFRAATPDADGTAIDLDDPRTVAGLTALEPVLIAAGVAQAGWADEVLNG